MLAQLLERAGEVFQQPGIIRRVSKGELKVGACEVEPPHCFVAIGDSFVRLGAVGLLTLQGPETFQRESDIAERQLRARLAQETSGSWRARAGQPHRTDLQVSACGASSRGQTAANQQNIRPPRHLSLPHEARAELPSLPG